MLNKHPVKDWSVTQTVIATSSGEAEYYGMVKGASQGIGLRSVMEDLGVNKLGLGPMPQPLKALPVDEDWAR